MKAAGFVAEQQRRQMIHKTHSIQLSYGRLIECWILTCLGCSAKIIYQILWFWLEQQLGVVDQKIDLFKENNNMQKKRHE